jgi:hypothetical protein
MVGKYFQKKVLLKVLEVLEDKYLVCNVGKENDRWHIDKDVFEDSYIEAGTVHNKKDITDSTIPPTLPSDK